MRSFKEYYEDWCPLRNLALLDDATVKMIKTLSSHIYQVWSQSHASNPFIRGSQI